MNFISGSQGHENATTCFMAQRMDPHIDLSCCKWKICAGWEFIQNCDGKLKAQIREQILVPDLYVLTVESATYKKRLKREKKIPPPKKKKN